MKDIKLLQSPLNANEIDFRIQSISAKGCAIILAYKDARVDMNRLNKAFGVGRWQRKHELINGNLFCSVGVWDEDINQWAWVQDVGTESNTEKEKGQASDSFKRACFNLGIGIELYDFPLIMVKLEPKEFTTYTETYKGKEKTRGKQTYDLKLNQWRWLIKRDEDQNMTLLAARDQNDKLRFKYEDKK